MVLKEDKLNTAIQILFTKFIRGNCSDTEYELVIELIRDGNHEVEFDEALSSFASAAIEVPARAFLDLATQNAMFDRIDTTLNDRRIRSTRNPIRLWLKWSIAAALTIIAGSLYYLEQSNNRIPIVKSLAKIDAAPGINTALLTLSSGRQIVLNNSDNGIIALENGTRVIKSADGKIKYEALKNGSAELNKIETPRGGKYQVLLPDGSQVWLNASSYIRFPVSFAQAKERVIEFAGEGYFEIAKDKSHPFIVKFAGKSLKVLGTHFNINDYPNESLSKTTLLEGSIELQTSGQRRLLKPGQQAIIQKSTNNLAVQNIETETAIAWTKGIFKFEDTDLNTIMNQIERWYNVDVIYEEGVENLRFSGGTKMNNNLIEVLKVLELNGVHFRYENKKIIVSKQ
ncbi:FecR domain-containing protein [Pedobacter frigidisoli]|uniref:FecR domain-containing protein n=1 Tax=Pedobacter frigidisoli TaxID=2530455 RepID=UPI00292D34E4|nr:FecR domain-containing protein [Pedobacter frigidisoli]